MYFFFYLIHDFFFVSKKKLRAIYFSQLLWIFRKDSSFFLMTSITSGSDSEHLGIPKAVFVEDVDSFMQQPENDSADTVIRR
jgi:hypothetical protein